MSYPGIYSFMHMHMDMWRAETHRHPHKHTYWPHLSTHKQHDSSLKTRDDMNWKKKRVKENQKKGIIAASGIHGYVRSLHRICMYV